MNRFSRTKATSVPRRRQTGATSAIDTARNGSEEARQAREQHYSFRRNQTLTGSASSGVTGAGASTSATLKSPRVQAHDLAQYRRNLGVVLVAVVAAVIILCILVAQFTATAVVRTSTPLRFDDAMYSAHVSDYLRSHPAQRLRFLLNEQQLTDYMQTVTPEVASLRLDGSAGFGVSRFIATFRTPIVGWSVSGSRQYVDDTGVAFTRNYFDDAVVQIIDQSGVQVREGSAIASDRFLGFIGRMVGAAAKQGYTVQRITIPRDTTRQVELGLKEVSYVVKVSVDRSVGEQAEDMSHALRWLRSRSLTPDYLDVRVSGRAFYK